MTGRTQIITLAGMIVSAALLAGNPVQATGLDAATNAQPVTENAGLLMNVSYGSYGEHRRFVHRSFFHRPFFHRAFAFQRFHHRPFFVHRFHRCYYC